jgi:DNA-binding winged helix-turn-helix (wHTH) protein
MAESVQRVTYDFGSFQVDPAQRLLRSRTKGEPLPLTAKAFDTLLCLVEHPGELIDKATLVKAIWPRVVVEENNFNQNVSALRRVLGERVGEHRFIVTEAGRGYRFVADVRVVPAAGITDTRA